MAHSFRRFRELSHEGACYTPRDADLRSGTTGAPAESFATCMTNSGLTNRLRQQSRRSGFAVGVAMAATILLCVAGFVVIYAQVDPLTRDFIGADPTATIARENATGGGSSSGENDSGADEEEEDTPVPDPTETAEPTATEDGFQITHLSNTSDSVNFRSGPGTDFGVIQTISPGTALNATGENGVAGDGLTWLEFELEDGTVGWIREIDTVEQ